MHVPTSRTRLAPEAMTSARSRRAEAGWTSGRPLSRPSSSIARSSGITACVQPIEIPFNHVVDDLSHGETDCKLITRCAIPRLSPRSDHPATPMPCSTSSMLAGVDVFRFNFSHGTHETHAASYARVRAAADRAGRTLAVLQDLSGPKIRTGSLAGGTAIPLSPGDELRIATGDFVGGPGRVSTTFAPLAQAVRPEQDLLLDDGRIVLRVIATDGTEIRTRVVHGTALGERKGINAPGVALPSAGSDAEGCRRSALRTGAGRRHGGAELRADRRRPPGRAGGHGQQRARRVSRSSRRSSGRSRSLTWTRCSTPVTA